MSRLRAGAFVAACVLLVAATAVARTSAAPTGAATDCAAIEQASFSADSGVVLLGKTLREAQQALADTKKALASATGPAVKKVLAAGRSKELNRVLLDTQRNLRLSVSASSAGVAHLKKTLAAATAIQQGLRALLCKKRTLAVRGDDCDSIERLISQAEDDLVELGKSLQKLEPALDKAKKTRAVLDAEYKKLEKAGWFGSFGLSEDFRGQLLETLRKSLLAIKKVTAAIADTKQEIANTKLLLQGLRGLLATCKAPPPPSLFTYAFSGLTISWDGPDVPNVGRTHVTVTLSGGGCGNAQSSRWAGTFQVQSTGVPPTLPWGGTFTGSTPTLVYTWNTDSNGTRLGEVQTRLVLDAAGLTMKIDPVQTGDIVNVAVGAPATVVSKAVASCATA